MEKILTILRDPIWQSIGVFVAIALALISFIKDDLNPRFSLVFIKKFLWADAIPLLSAFSIISIVWNILWLSIGFNLAVIIVFGVKQVKSQKEDGKDEKLRDFRKPTDSSPRYPKSTRR